eukprot:9500350-Pyramimonas_sp.AAC.2
MCAARSAIQREASAAHRSSPLAVSFGEPPTGLMYTTHTGPWSDMVLSEPQLTLHVSCEWPRPPAPSVHRAAW